LRRRISSYTRPAWTGLPPGLLMRTITAFAPGAANAERSPSMSRSALARDLSAIIPLTSISAVCVPTGVASSPGSEETFKTANNTTKR